VSCKCFKQNTPFDCCNTLHHTASHCNTLQHAATRCNTLQHAATQVPTVSRTCFMWGTPLDSDSEGVTDITATYCSNDVMDQLREADAIVTDSILANDLQVIFVLGSFGGVFLGFACVECGSVILFHTHTHAHTHMHTHTCTHTHAHTHT